MRGRDVDTVIKFDPALPCGTISGDVLCNKPAHVGIAYPAAGGWMLQPMCQDCTANLVRIYSVVWMADELKSDKEQHKHES